MAMPNGVRRRYASQLRCVFGFRWNVLSGGRGKLLSDGGLFHAMDPWNAIPRCSVGTVCVLGNRIHPMDADRNFVSFHECIYIVTFLSAALPRLHQHSAEDQLQHHSTMWSDHFFTTSDVLRWLLRVLQHLERNS